MNRTEFLEQLERLLWDIPESERKEALEYYQDYFEDAGAVAYIFSASTQAGGQRA